ncbi:MAG: transpeptidase family protein [Dysgonamonadaceae bacterium]|nr:transpeptidase family protein [Dysgonamonadaceae bacterium]
MKYFIITVFVILVAVAILGRAFYISMIEGSLWRKYSANQVVVSVPVSAVRGNIYSCDHQLMAASEAHYWLYIDFWAEGIKKDTLYSYLDTLACELNSMFPSKSVSQYKERLEKGWKTRENGGKRQNRRYRLLDHDVNYLQWVKIDTMPYFKKGRNKSGLYRDTVYRRVYPFETLALRTIGRTNTNEDGKKGIYGLECYYDSLLRGEDGIAVRRKINGRTQDVITQKPVNGKDIVSTIDITIQDITERALLDKLKILDAESGTAVVMEAATGEIKAITNMGRVSEGVWDESRRNFALSDMSEPGSTFKVVSMMVALEDGLVHPDDSVNVGNGVTKIAGQHLEDHNAKSGGYGMITAAQCIKYSSNIGVAKLIMNAYKNNPSKYVDGIYKIGLNKDMELEIPGYGVPRIQHPDDKNRYWDATALPWMSFGYRTQIPPIYTLTFFNAIANNGKMVKPIFTREIQEEGKTVEKIKPQVVNKQICSKNTLNIIRQMLDSVVNQPGGTGKFAHSDFVRIAGKTGTAQISHGKAGYKSGGTRHQVSFCGYFPADDPKYSCIVVIRNPRNGGASGGGMCGPVFREIAEEIYAQNKIPNTSVLQIDTLHQFLPEVKSGLVEPSVYVMKKLDVAYKDSTDGKWQFSGCKNEKIVLKDRSIRENLTPNVIGMGAKDAIYAMESAGLRVLLYGKGAVTSQSIAPGTKTPKGQTVTLTLK